MRYWIVSSAHGRLGGICFAAAGCQVGPRDRMVGRAADARMANPDRVVRNHRFLILPPVRVHRLASRVPPPATDRIADDREARHRARPALACTFTGVDGGWSWRAARRRRCPEPTSGRRSGIRRAVWLKPLEPDWRGTPVRGPHRPLGWSDPVPGEGEWADVEWAGREYARSMHTDGRVRRRLVEMGKAWQKRPDRPLPEILPGKAEQRAAHRMLSNPGVRMEHIVEPHFESTCGRCRAERFVLAIQDTTTPIVTVSRRPGGPPAWAAASAAGASPTMSGWRPPPPAAPWACSRGRGLPPGR